MMQVLEQDLKNFNARLDLGYCTNLHEEYVPSLDEH
jgi:hypothetical protein